VEERLELEVQRGIEIVVAPLEPAWPAVEHASEDLVGRMVAEFAPDSIVEEPLLLVIGYEALPEGVVAAEIGIGIPLFGGGEVAPRIAAEELVPARPGED